MKIAKGTYRADRDGALEEHVSDERLAAAPPPPSDLGEAGKAAWSEAAACLVRMQILSRSHLSLLMRFARAHDEVAKCDALIVKAGGEDYQNRFGEWKQHPAVGRRFRWLEIIRRAETEMGLTPSSERSLRTSGTGKPKSRVPSRKRA